VIEFARWLQATAVSVGIQSVEWIIPLVQSVHIVMIGVVFVSILMISLRVLGKVRTDETFEQVWHRFAPWMWSGLVVMAGTGLTLILGEPVREFTALSFWLKMGLIVVAVTTTFFFGRALRPAMRAPLARTPGAEFSPTTKLAVIGTLVVWLAIVFLGRAIAYDVEVWGKFSLHA
jgi:uncharacterized membrane protein SirB2